MITRNLKFFAGLLVLTLSQSVQAQYYNLQGFWKASGPTSNTWTTLTPSGAPTSKGWFSSVWTGSKMVVWGGFNNSSVVVNTGGIYDPATNTWSTISTVGAPTARTEMATVWTGSKMLVWGGGDYGSALYGDGAAYDPGANTWSTISSTGAPSARADMQTVWTGTEMLIWGGYSGGTGAGSIVNTGGRYNPSTDTWGTAPTTTGAPSTGGAQGQAAWSGTEMLIWGFGESGGTTPTTGARYNPSSNTWTTMTTTGVPSGRMEAVSVWSGSKFLIWGGTSNTCTDTGGVYDPASNSWATMTTSGAPQAAYSMSGVWGNAKFFVWGGVLDASPWTSNQGGLYDYLDSHNHNKCAERT